MDAILCQDKEIGYFSDDGVHSLSSLIKTPAHSPVKSFTSPNTEMRCATTIPLSPPYSRQFSESNHVHFRLDDDIEMQGLDSKKLCENEVGLHSNGAAGGGLCGSVMPTGTYKAKLLLSMETQDKPWTINPCESQTEIFDFMLDGCSSLDDIEDCLDMEYYHKQNTVQTTWMWCLELKRTSKSQWIEFLGANDIEVEVSKMNIEREELMKRIEIATGCLVGLRFYSEEIVKFNSKNGSCFYDAADVAKKNSDGISAISREFREYTERNLFLYMCSVVGKFKAEIMHWAMSDDVSIHSIRSSARKHVELGALRKNKESIDFLHGLLKEECKGMGSIGDLQSERTIVLSVMKAESLRNEILYIKEQLCGVLHVTINKAIESSYFHALHMEALQLVIQKNPHMQTSLVNSDNEFWSMCHRRFIPKPVEFCTGEGVAINLPYQKLHVDPVRGHILVLEGQISCVMHDCAGFISQVSS